MYKNFIGIFSFILFISSCDEKKKVNNDEFIESISLNPHEAVEFVNLSEIADSIKCIRLQTDSNDVLGRIREIVIRQKYIYAMDMSQQMIFVFDKEGKFVAKLNKRGQGPDEYTVIGPFFIDDNEKYMEIVDYAGKCTLLKYSNISFDLVDKIPFPDIKFNQFRRHNGFYYFATQQQNNTINGKKTNAGLIIVNDKNEDEYKVLFDKKIETGNHGYSPFSESFTINDRNELFLTLMYDNTFYRLDGEKAYPIFSVDFGKYGINNKMGLEPVEKQSKYIKNVNGLASFPVLNINNSDIMSFSYYFKQSEEERMYREEDFRQYIKMKKSNKVYHTKKMKNDITDFPNHIYINNFFNAHEVWYENYLVDIIFPDRYFSDDTSKIYVEGLGEITAYDDPIVVLIKLKEN
ncbi:MAG: 6-bladed beta-propeller [Tannerella sp.]|jgi:hypothetical protein|nr:6-bladed beta-propeller [Tannerella sp.]